MKAFAQSTTTGAALALALALAASGDAHAQSKCTSASKVATAIWDKYGAALKKAGCKKGGDQCAKAEQVVRDMVAFWNEQVGGSWATIGPREILFEGKLDGKVVAGGERLFITKMPLEDADEVTVTIKKEGGKAPATVSLSAVADDGKCIEGTDASFAEGDKDGQTRTIKMHGLRGRLVVIKVDAQKGKAFDYELTVRKN